MVDSAGDAGDGSPPRRLVGVGAVRSSRIGVQMLRENQQDPPERGCSKLDVTERDACSPLICRPKAARSHRIRQSMPANATTPCLKILVL